MKRKMADRRGRPRFEIVGQLWGSVDTIVRLPLRNISTGGALARSGVRLQEASEHHVTITCDGAPAPTKVRVCHVAHATGEDGLIGYLIGFEFLNVTPVLREQIETWLRAAGGASVGA